VANLLPACVEASQSHVPLVFLTADRPAELRGTGANQTIMQPGIFGGYVRFAADLPCPEDTERFDDLAGPLREALCVAMGPRPGPVHVNLQFREPLLGGEDVDLFVGLQEKPHPASWTVQLPVDWPRFSSARRGVVVIGRLDVASQREAASAVALGKLLGWPVIGDALSGARHFPGVVRHADWLLRQGDVPMPERVLHFGGSLVSKRLGEWISASCGGADWLQVLPTGDRWDPWASAPSVVSARIGPFCEAASEVVMASGDRSWGESWERADAVVGGFLESALGMGEFNEPVIARIVGKHAEVVFLGNSMPVRDFDASDRVEHLGGRLIFGNRGASGIDGNVGTIAGVARGCGRPVVALLGDLAVLHDLNSLLLLRGLPVTLVVVNNDGGGIFRFLPLSVPEAERERLWETPHGMDFVHAAAQFGIPYFRIEGVRELEECLKSPCDGPRMLECRTDRAANHVLHRDLAAGISGLTINWSL
jgi:2-succinyl-5-enolpyruvyl-6-hydroxy-3-cyclohexene-1-carboxylate synthase